MAKKSAPKKKRKSFEGMTWHFFLPAVGGFIITWIFSMSLTLSLEVGLVVLICSFLARWLKG